MQVALISKQGQCFINDYSYNIQLKLEIWNESTLLHPALPSQLQRCAC